MSVAVVKPGNDVEVQRPGGYCLNLQQAALSTESADSKGSMLLKVPTIAIEGDKIVSILGTLRPVTMEQFSLGKSGYV